MSPRVIFLLTVLLCPAWARGAEGEEALEERLDELLSAVAELTPDVAPERELYLRMESGFALIELERYPLAEPHFERALDVARAMEAPGMVVTNLASLVEIAFRKGELEQGRELSAEAMEVAHSMQRVDLQQSLEINLGSIELRLGEHAAAVDALSRALELQDEAGDPMILATILSNLGVAYMALGSYESALMVLDRALPVMEGLGSEEGVATVLSNLGDVHFLAGDPETALELMEEALAMRLDLGLRSDSSISYRSIGRTLLALGRTEEAEASLEKALTIQRELELGPELVSTLAAMAELHASMDRWEPATMAAVEGAELAESMRLRDQRVLNLDALSRAYSAQGRMAEALEYEREARELREEMDNAEIVRALNDLSLRYEGLRNRQELALLRKDYQLKRMQRNVLFAGAALLLAFGALGWTFYLLRGRVLGKIDQANRDLFLANQSTSARTRELEQAMQEVRELQEERLRADKLESIGVLAAGIAHDFNNVLATVLGNVTMARSSLADRAAEERMLQDAEDAVVQGRRLSSQLLAFSKGGEPQRELHSLPEILRSSAGFSSAGSNARLSFEFQTGLWPVEVDVGQISQLISNLVLNAIQAMPDGGRIEVAACNIAPAPSGDRADPLVRVCVADSGPGIPDSIRQEVFDPYFTTKTRGSGLGLTTAYAIARRHGGALRLRSSSEGATFEFDLPAVPGGLLEVQPHAKEIEHGGGRILVLDDDPLVLSFYDRALTELGYEPVLASNGEAALAFFDEARGEGLEFDAAILDLTLPGGPDGTQVLADLRERDPDVRAIVASGYADSPVLARYRQEGFRGALTKPFGLARLSRVLGEVLAEPASPFPVNLDHVG